MSDAPGRVALITGASRGIGCATAVALGAAGMRVVVGYARDEQGAAETVARVEEHGAEAMPVAVRVEDAASVDAAFTRIEDAFGPVTVLVNNAGVTSDGLVMRMDDAAWDQVLAVNLSGAFHTIRRAVPKMMRARHGRIVNVASASGHMGGPGQANYAASKAGLLGLSRSVARELGSRGITCNVVAPGPIVTAMTDAMGQEWQETMASVIPLGRLGSPDECAAVIAFLCSDVASYVTGALVPVDGGLGMGA